MPHTKNHPQILKNMSKTPVLCVGDVMLDNFIYGAVNRVSPEAPVPILLQSHATSMAGGVGNVASNLASLGCDVRLVSVAGQDEDRPKLEAALGNSIKFTLVTDPSRPTISKTRYVAGHQHVLRVDVEDTKPVPPAIEDALLKAAQDALKGVKALILSDYGKGVLTPRLIQSLIDAATKAGIPVVVDPKGHDYTRYRGATVITPNRKELGEATRGMPTATDSDIELAARTLIADAGVKAVIATRSADGLSVIARDEATHLKTQAREVFDVSGAGDTVVAVTAAALANGAHLAEAAALANLAAGLVVEKVGTATVQPDELAEALVGTGTDSHASGRTFAPVLTWADARAQVDRWKAKGLKVGFTNGCFDILHQGHVMMLDRCRAACDKLVLGLNTDASISRLKGPSRPVNPAAARAAVIAALGSIDAVVMFGENADEKDTPLELMKALCPDMIFKGKDYTVDKVVGADFVQSYGGQVVLIDLEEGFSTTGTIKKMQSAA
ncbi:MAG: D-glycero-beta-D-manno-heptose-7-phosphate kinase [Alphaproteobacteria bacterium]|nr:D-glycero-beta-D-manno-heptose-7-phosphate kinase [Alphaproteobacteria bacterium]